MTPHPVSCLELQSCAYSSRAALSRPVVDAQTSSAQRAQRAPSVRPGVGEAKGLEPQVQVGVRILHRGGAMEAQAQEG